MRDKNRHTKHTIRMCIFCGGFLACSLLEPCLRVRRKIYNESVYWHVENIYYYNKNTTKKQRNIQKNALSLHTKLSWEVCCKKHEENPI